MEETLIKSYLQARDPSIMSYNRTNLKDVKTNLNNLMESNNTVVESEDKNEDSKFLNVYLRIRGDVQEYDLYNIDGESLICNVPKGCYTFRNVKTNDATKRTYSFTKIFGPECEQKEIFNNIAKPKLLSFINGRNSTLFTYGASGSGKTFTIVGTSEEPGLIPRALEYMFRSIPNISQKPIVKPMPNGQTEYFSRKMMTANEQYKDAVINATIFDQAAHLQTYKQMQQRLSSEPVANITDSPDVSVSVWVSFAEIYNETIYDLLSLPVARNQPRQRLALGKSKDNTYIKNLATIYIRNGLEAYQILQYGLHNLNYAATAINSHSSRSHCIFTIKLVQSSRSNPDVYISSFNFCDLAGSERLKKTMNFGDRLKESTNINTSLLVLGRCMENIRKCQQIKDKRLIPFRESKLTQIFQKALLGYENVEMIVNVNPSKDMFDETIHVLNFSAIAKTIVVEEEIPRPTKNRNRFSVLMTNEDSPILRKIISERHEIEALREQYNAAQNEIRKLQREVKYLRQELNNTSTDDKNDEIAHLHRAIDHVIEERDNIIKLHEAQIKEEKERAVEIYEKCVAKLRERYDKDKEEALERIRKEYERKMSDMEVITISSSDEEGSPQKGSRRSERELEKKVADFEKLVGEMSDELRELRTSLEDKESLLEDAKEHCTLLQLEIERCCKKYNKERSENIMLLEEIESLKLQLLHKSTDVPSEGSTAENDEEIEDPLPSLEPPFDDVDPVPSLELHSDEMKNQLDE